MHNPWQSELSWSLLALLAILFVGWLFDATVLSLFLFVVALLARHLYQIARLERWLSGGGSGQPPHGRGIWEEIYYQLLQIKRQNKRQKKRLGKILTRFRKATAALPDATVVLGPNDEIDWFNKSAGQLLSLRKGDRGQNIGNLVRHPDFAAYLRQKTYGDAVSIPGPSDFAINLEVRIVPYGAGLRLLVAQDVTHIRRMERIRSDFVANASHELRTPLTVLKGYLETLVDYEAFPATITAALVRMEEQSTRMQQLIDDLLLLTRLETKQPQQSTEEQVTMGSLLESICRESKMLNSVHRDIELRIETDANLMGNPNELRSAFSNLIINALKYSPATAMVSVRWYGTENGARLDVIDRGEGIAPSHLSKLTERFYRVDVKRSRQQGGTGLGLAIVNHVLTRHDAALHIESEPGKGSCFSCRFPRQRIVEANRRVGIEPS